MKHRFNHGIKGVEQLETIWEKLDLHVVEIDESQREIVLPDNYRDFIADLPTDQLLKNWWEYTDYEWRHYKTTTQSQREVRVQREADQPKKKNGKNLR